MWKSNLKIAKSQETKKQPRNWGIFKNMTKILATININPKYI